jgi:hypothetical protein
MYNQLIVNKLLQEHGVEHTIIYCRMESDVKSQMYEECKKITTLRQEDFADYAYDRDWWANKAIDLKKQLDDERAARESSPDSKAD